MSLAALESLRQALIAAQLSPEPVLRRLALARYERAWRAIAACAPALQPDLHGQLFRMLPSDWPLWIERYRPAPQDSGLSRTLAA